MNRQIKIFIWTGFLAGFIYCGSSHAREFEVRLLSGTAQNGAWGTKEFEASVSSLGVVRLVKVHGREVIWQAAALYTSPVPPDGAAGARAIQGEGFGTRGLSVEQPRMTTRDELGTRIFEFDILVANTNVLAGKPLCKVFEKVALTPNGEIHVSYDCEWLQTLRWDGFDLQLIFNKEQCKGRDYMAKASNGIMAGKLDPGPSAERQIRAVRFKQLTVRPETGPFHIVLDAEALCFLYWGSGSPRLHMKPPALPRRGFIYQGQKERLAYRILLPVSQQ